MLTGHRLAVLGAGQMGEALCKGFIDAGLLAANQILVSDINEERLDHFKSAYGIMSAANNADTVRNASIVMLAVKPQQMDVVLEEIRDAIGGEALVITIAAGITTGRIVDGLGKPVKVVRVMPNTPALVGAAMSVISRGTHANDESADIARAMFQAVGDVIELPEEQINQVTAISGSGPAYFFLLVESMIDAGLQAGLERDAATKLVIGTIFGSAMLLKAGDKNASQLREMVTSPGGTTAAALQVFSNREFRFIVQEAVNAAIKRAEELA